MGEHCLQSLFDQINVRLRRRDAGLGLFLKRMQHVNRISHVHRVDSTERIAPMILD